jgi:hypothetical protein
MNQPPPKAVFPERSEYPIAAGITLIVVALSFFLHWKWCGSYMQLSEDFFVKSHQLRFDTYPFSIRPFMHYSIELLGRLFSSEVKTSFFVIQFSLAASIGLSFYYYLRQLRFSLGWSRVGLFLVLSAYPILAAHIEPMHTWDDLWAHLFIILAFLALLKSHLLVGLLWFTLSCFAREQSLIFYGPILVTAMMYCPHFSRRRILIMSTVPVAIYAIYYFIVWQTPDSARYSLILFNFENPLRISDTLFSLYISFGVLWPLSMVALFGKNSDRPVRLLKIGTWLTLPATLVLTLFFTNVRETRILFPPFLFMIPLAVLTLQRIFEYLRPRMSVKFAAIGLVIFAALMTIGVWLGYEVFPDFEYRRCTNFQRQWAGIHFGLIFSLIAFWIARAWSRTNDQSI